MARASASPHVPTVGASEHAPRRSGRRILAVDIGGSNVKFLCTGRTKPCSFPSGPDMKPAAMLDKLSKATRNWQVDCVSIGYPGLVGASGPRSEPLNLGPGWVGFDFATALGKPVRIVNDAVMQALGSYEGGRMLFLGLGTGLGSTLIIDDVVVPLELGALRGSRKRLLGEILGDEGRRRIGKRRWRRKVSRAVEQLGAAFNVDYIVLGGGNARRLRDVPAIARIGNNLAAFRGGFRVWSGSDADTPVKRKAQRSRRQLTIL